VALREAPAGLVAEARDVRGGADDVGEAERERAREAAAQDLGEAVLEADDLRQAEVLEIEIHGARERTSGA
jgi:hypothetical protein